MTADDLKALRASMGWSQAELADRLGISQSQVHRIEVGKCGLTKPLQIVLSHLTAELQQGSAA